MGSEVSKNNFEEVNNNEYNNEDSIDIKSTQKYYIIKKKNFEYNSDKQKKK